MIRLLIDVPDDAVEHEELARAIMEHRTAFIVGITIGPNLVGVIVGATQVYL